MHKNSTLTCISDLVKQGKSFRFCNEWKNDVSYINNNSIQDWVVYDDKLYACKKSNINTPPTDKKNWTLVLKSFVPDFELIDRNLYYRINDGELVEIAELIPTFEILNDRLYYTINGEKKEAGIVEGKLFWKRYE